VYGLFTILASKKLTKVKNFLPYKIFNPGQAISISIEVLAKFAATALGPLEGFQGAKPLGRRRHIFRASGGRGLTGPGPRRMKMRVDPNVLDVFARPSTY
jgi:hypothetical protein